MARNSFVFYESFYSATLLLQDPARRLEALDAICRYALYDEEPNATGELKIMMALVMPLVDSNKKRAEAGKRGGRPPKHGGLDVMQNQGKTNGLTTPIKDVNDNDNVNVNGEYEGDSSPSTPSAKALTAKQAQQMVDDTGLPPAADQAIRDWLEYKKERRQGYKTTGLKTLLTIAKRNADLYGGDAIAELIQSSIAAQYQGITWDKLKSLPERRTRFNDMEML